MVIALFLYIARCRRTEVQSRRPHRMRENRREVAGFQILTHENICVGQTLGWLGNYHTAGICSAIKWHFSDWALLGHRNKQRLPRTNGVCLLGSERASHTAIRGQTQLLGSTPTMTEEAMRVPLRKVDEIEPRSWVACCAWLQQKGPVRDITVVRIWNELR